VRNVYEFGEATRRQYVAALARRESLSAYIGQAVRAAAKQGVPVVQPLVLKWQDDPNTYSIGDEFMLGDELLVAPALGPQTSREVYLPCGEWIDESSGRAYSAGREGLRLSVPTPLNAPPPAFRAK
jgi:alpha-glucosidase (family GH31 glycosyl hydrolase)